MIPKTFLAAAVAAALLAAPWTAKAWSNQGHMITGAIAYDDLAASDPSLVTGVEKIMKAHPQWARFEAGLTGYTGEARQRRLFELMARWPDDARGGPYDHPAWHYLFRTVPSVADPIAIPPALLAASVGQAREAWALNLATARDAFAPPAERAVALCWLFHLAGDLQQPLHAAALVSARFPMSDEGGAIDYVRAAPAAPAAAMHAYWDDIVGGDETDDANVEAQRLRLEKLWPRARLPELNGLASEAAFLGWTDESLGLARQAAYDDGHFQGGASATNAVVLTGPMRAQWQGLGERRIAVSGHRIADSIRAVF